MRGLVVALLSGFASAFALTSAGLLVPLSKAHPVQRRTSFSLAAEKAKGPLDFFWGWYLKPPVEEDPFAKQSNCKRCSGSGAVDCATCKGAGYDKKNGNAMERFKCRQCQGFSVVACQKCSASGGGLTPEQRGQR
jgi:hypothetical protein